MIETLSFFRGKTVLVTGHTGFKGAWICKVLLKAEANVIGYALDPPTKPNLFEILELDKKMVSVFGDIRNGQLLLECFKKYQPDIVIHMAAQSIVRVSYENPIYTYETNIMGTLNVLECNRKTNCVKSFVNVTTDKVYQNEEWCWGYRESDRLNGYDPYSNSKACSELVTDGYKKSFFQEGQVAVSTARAGNVIGGGDFAKDRIIPDCVRAIQNKKDIQVRNPHSIRPYQHVLEAIFAYLLIAKKQYENVKLAGNYNIGPKELDCITTCELVQLLCEYWKDGIRWTVKNESGPHEANFLKLDCSKMKEVFLWQPIWNIDKAVEKTVEWTKVYLDNRKIDTITDMQISAYCEDYGKFRKV